MLTFDDLLEVVAVKRDGVWLGTIEGWEGEARYVHSPDRRETFNSLRVEELREIIAKMEEFL